ncbi:MAG: HAMP domain-containing histidine kinase [Candidatus Dormibacteraeota bacterium]|nr:HAMP domain-containing histidine kinase [Candidatus Dormibacteraeota bacterium]
MNRRLERVHVESLRVALMAAGAFAVVYAIVAALVVVLVTHNLTSTVDNRLTTVLTSIEAQAAGQPTQVVAPSLREPGGGQLGASPLLAWVVAPDGSQFPTRGAPTLPSSELAVSDPTTVTLEGVEFRIAGASVSGERVVVGQSMYEVSQTRSTVSFIETIVGLVLLIVAFVGALIGGRRVGAPIELARQRQMEFTADASHELRTPLSVIEAQTSLALSQEREASWYRDAFQRIGNESGRIRRLVEDLLWLARVDTEPGQTYAEPVELGVLASQAVERFGAVAEARGLSLSCFVSDGPHMVTGSPDWLDRLFGVLIDNACKYTPERGAVRVSVDNDGGRVVLRVEDGGPGIPAEERSLIFERFHRATSSQSGAGLGLAIADAVVRRTHGRWEVGTSAGLGGASVAVSWPRSGSGSKEPGRAPVAVSPPPLPGPIVSNPAPPPA